MSESENQPTERSVEHHFFSNFLGMQIEYWVENLKTVYLVRRKARRAFWPGDLNLITLRHNKDVIKQIGPTTHNLNEFFLKFQHSSSTDKQRVNI